MINFIELDEMSLRRVDMLSLGWGDQPKKIPLRNDRDAFLRELHAVLSIFGQASYGSVGDFEFIFNPNPDPDKPWFFSFVANAWNSDVTLKLEELLTKSRKNLDREFSIFVDHPKFYLSFSCAGKIDVFYNPKKISHKSVRSIVMN